MVDPIRYDFSTDSQGWTTVDNGPSAYFGSGGNPDGYFGGSDGGTGVWYYRAPTTMLGDRESFFGGSLSFDLMQADTSSQFPDEDVILEGGGLVIVATLPAHPGTAWTSYTIDFEVGTFRIGTTSGRIATEEEIRTVLADLQRVDIRGEYRNGADSSGIDNIVLAEGPVGAPTFGTTSIVSSFDSSTEGWAFREDVSQFGHVAADGNPGGYLEAVDAVAGLIWYFVAPEAYLGDKSAYHGGQLSFDLRQSLTSSQINHEDVILRSDSLVLVFNTASNPGTDWTHYVLTLDTATAWQVGDLSGPLATEEQIQEVLANLTAFEIRGEYRSGSDTGGLDNVVMQTPDGTISGTENPDSLEGTASADTIFGLAGDDTLFGNAGNDTLDGGEGDDWLEGGLGNDVLLGGAGIDTISYASAGARVTVNLSVSGAYGTGGAGVDSWAGVENVVGSNFDDNIIGDGVDNRLDGGGGDDKLVGGAGNDELLGGEGNDKLVGDAGDDHLVGDLGDDVLKGKDGLDTMEGGAGNDRYVVQDTLDLVIEDADAGIDTVRIAVDYVMSDNVENLQILGKTGLTATGNALGNIMTGSRGEDTIQGMDGADDIYGEEGSDTIYGGNQNDRIWGGTHVDILHGDAGDDVLRGENGGDMLYGGTGADRLTGGLGADDLYGGADADTFIFDQLDTSSNRSNADWIHDFSSAEDDVLFLARMDANTTLGGDQAFAFIGNAAFSGVAGQLHYVHDGAYTYVEGDTNGDSIADFAIRLTGTLTLEAGDFVL